MKNKKYLYPLVIGLLVIGIFSCIAGLIIQYATDGFVENEIMLTDNRSVSNFDKVIFTGTGELTISQGEIESLTIESSEKKLKTITSELKHGTLTLSDANTPFRISLHTSLTPIKYNLVVKNLNQYYSEGVGTSIINGLDTEKLVIKQDGVGDIYIHNLKANSITITMNGTGSTIIAGEVQSQTLNSNGVGSYEAENLKSYNATVKMTGVGSAKIWTIDTLSAELTGIGSLEYYGSPEVREFSKGLGTVDRVGETPK